MLDIMYGHRVDDRTERFGPDWRNMIDVSSFESVLASERSWIDPGVLCDRSRLRSYVESNAAYSILTLDDGYRDNLYNALPLLRYHGVPAAIFITSGFIDRTSVPIPDMLARIISRQDVVAAESVGVYQCGDMLEKWAVYDKIRTLIKSLPYRRQIAVCRDLSGAQYDEIRSDVESEFMDWDEVRMCAESGVVMIGGHTRTHPELRRRMFGSVVWEILYDRIRLERKIAGAGRIFAYPYGSNKITTRVAAMLAGYKAAVTTECTEWDANRALAQMRIGRCDIHDAVAKGNTTAKKEGTDG